MKVQLAYGTGFVEVDLPDAQTTVINPAEQEGLADERRSLLTALDSPVGVSSLRDRIREASRICIVFTDNTRPTPNEKIIPWILEYLAICGVRREQVILLNASGTHRPNSREQLRAMLTPAVVENYRVFDHEPENPDALVHVGATSTGDPALINRHLVEADVRIITGFIEPHFFAGFSGGPKGIMPGVAGLKTVLSNHGRANIADPNAAFGITEGNPIWEEMRDIALRVGPSFLVNVTLNEKRAITGVFAGGLVAAHKVGIEFVKKSAMQPVAEPFDMVITTNSGYPLDQNLYQSVKGMSAAARIVRQGGDIIMAAECRMGLPDGSPYDQLLRRAKDPEDILALIAGDTFPEQWQAQIQALIQRKAAIYIYSSLPEAAVRAAHLLPCAEIEATVKKLCEKSGGATRIAVLPQGPLTVPYLSR
jgi:nickel-dependent lactate racemase